MDLKTIKITKANKNLKNRGFKENQVVKANIDSRDVAWIEDLPEAAPLMVLKDAYKIIEERKELTNEKKKEDQTTDKQKK